MQRIRLITVKTIKSYLPGEYCSSQRSIPFARSSRGGSIKPTAFGDSVKMLLPNLSSTALLCEPVFTDYAESAIWYKDGKKIATVDRSTFSSDSFRSSNPNRGLALDCVIVQSFFKFRSKILEVFLAI